MNYIDYYKQVLDDAIDAIDEQFDRGYWDADTRWDIAYDNLFCYDRVTGNASGSYIFNAYEARKNVADAIWDSEILDALFELGIDDDSVSQYLRDNDPEGLDVAIRCAILGRVYGEIEAHFYDRQLTLNS